MSYRLQDCEYRYLDTPNAWGRALVVIGQVPEALKNDPSFDDLIFWYAGTEEEFEKLFLKENGEDFYLVKENN